MSAFAASVVQVSMVDDNGEMRFILDKVKVPAGSITFKATNNSNADMLHEMLILKVDSDNTNLPYDEKCLEFYQNKSEVRTVSSVQVRQNFYSSSISLWKSYEK